MCRMNKRALCQESLVSAAAIANCILLEVICNENTRIETKETVEQVNLTPDLNINNFRRGFLGDCREIQFRC